MPFAAKQGFIGRPSPIVGLLWTPDQLTGLSLWLDAADDTTITLNGSKISQWNDKSGNGNHATQATASLQPEYVSAGQNGKNIVRTPSTPGNDIPCEMTIPHHTSLNLAGGTSVFHSFYERDGGYLFHKGTNITLTSTYFSNIASPLGYRAYYNSQAADITQQTAFTMGLGNWSPSEDRMEYWYNGNQVNMITEHVRNGAVVNGEIDPAQFPTDNTSPFVLFRNPTSDTWSYPGYDVGDIIIYNRKLTLAEQRKVEGYLAHKWGFTSYLPAGHPYKTQPPYITRIDAIDTIGAVQIDTAQSKFGGASGYFPVGSPVTDSRLSIKHDGQLNMGTSDFTWEFWYRPISRATSYPAICQTYQYGGGNGCFQFADRHNATNNKFSIWIVNRDAAAASMVSTSTVSDNTWYHLAVTRSGNVFRFFVNGVQESTVTWSGDVTAGTATTAKIVTIGNDTVSISATQLNAHIDEFRISNIARYTANFTPQTAPFTNDANTLLLLHMNGADGSTLFVDDEG